MTPIKFQESNKDLLKPVGMTDAECSSLPVFTDGKQCISLWQLTWKERFQVLFLGRIWLAVLSGQTQPPVWMDSRKTVFKNNSSSLTWFNLHPKFFHVLGLRFKWFNLFCRVFDEGWCWGVGLIQVNGRHLFYIGANEEKMQFRLLFVNSEFRHTKRKK